MKKLLLPLLLLGCFTSLAQNGDKDKDKVKKYHLLPVYLIYTGVPFDTASKRMVAEAFSRHNVKIIDKTTFDQMNSGEVLRIQTKFRAGNSQFGSERDVKDAIAREQKFVTNLLFVDFIAGPSKDSLVLTGASWEATPFPPNIYDSRSSGKIETTIPETCCSVKDNLAAIVDKILGAKWLR